MSYNSHTDQLAVARLDGSVEIFSFSSNCFQEKVIPGNEERSTESICWVNHNRLFTVGLNGEVVEYDLERLCPKYSTNAFGGPLWCVAPNSTGTHLAIGCEDGTVKVFQVIPEGIQFEKNLDRQKDRIICLSWHRSGTQIAAGSVDVIRIFDVTSGRAVQRIVVDRRIIKSYNTKQECLVWSLHFLTCHMIVSADSSGKVQFWDSKNGTLVQSQIVTNSDILALAVAESEDSMVIGTAEGTIFQFQLLPLKLGGKEAQWVMTKPFKYHTHDVRAVGHSKTALFSGGMDTHLAIRPLMEKVQSKSYDAAFRKISFPHRRFVSCAKKAKLLLFQFPDHLELWRLGSTDVTGKSGDVLPISKRQEHLLQLKRKGHDHICCSAVSPCGEWIAYATVSRLCLYRVEYEGDTVNVNKISKIPNIQQTAHHLLFSSDSKKLFIGSDQAAIHVVRLSTSACKYLHTLKPKSDIAEATCLLSSSTDGTWLAAANQSHKIDIYNLKEAKHHCTVPAYSCPPTSMAIHPVTNDLVIAYSDQQIFEFSIQENQYTAWSRQLQQHGLHKDWIERDTPITHLNFNPAKPNQILLHDTYMLCIIDKTLPLPDDKTPFYNQEALKQLSEKNRRKVAHAFKICKKFQPLLYADLLDNDSIVVVERPLMDIYAQLPPPVRQKKFGT